MKGKTRKLLPSSLEAWRVTAACHINCALKSGRFIVYMRGTKRAAECFHDTRTDEWRACTRRMRADGVHLQQPLEKSLSRAVPLAASARPVVFIFLAYSCKPSLTAFKQMWHQMDGNHNSFGPQILKRHPNRHFLHSYRGVRCYSSTWNIWKASTGAWGHMEMLLLARRPTHTLFSPLPYSDDKDHLWGVHMLIHLYSDTQPREHLVTSALWGPWHIRQKGRWRTKGSFMRENRYVRFHCPRTSVHPPCWLGC